MGDAMDREVRAALSATRELHAELGKREREPDEYKHLRRLAVRANKAVATMHRLARAEAQRAATHEALLREAIVAEGIDRQANAARLQDRLRTTVDRLVENDSSPFDRARTAVTTIDQAIDALCPHAHAVASGTALIAEMQQAKGAEH